MNISLIQKIFHPFTILVLFVVICLPSFAAETKVFTLKDGSRVRGQLNRFENGVYVIQTESLGQISLPETSVVTMTDETTVSAASVVPSATIPSLDGLKANADVISQAQEMQAQILSNPDLVVDIQKIADNPELMAILTDPALLSDLQAAVSSHNPEQVASDPRVQKLLNDPQMMALIRKLYQGSAQ